MNLDVLLQSVSFQELQLVNEKLLDSTKCSNKEDLLNVWQMTAKQCGTTEFLNQLARGFKRINREDIARKLEQQVKEVGRNAEPNERQPLLEKPDKSSKLKSGLLFWACVVKLKVLATTFILLTLYYRHTHKFIITITFIIIGTFICKRNCCILPLLVVMLLLTCCSVVALSVTGAVFLREQEPLTKVVAEDDTVSLVKIDKLTVSSLSITEEVWDKGDNDHRVLLTLVPTANLTYITKVRRDSWNGTTIVDGLPIINEMYVYLNHGSTLIYKICMGNGKSVGWTNLYVFDEESQYKDYMEDKLVDTPVLTQRIEIGGESETICGTIKFTAESDSYYYIIMMAPEKGTKFSYNVSTNENVVNIQNYVSSYPRCTVSSNSDTCSISTSSGSIPSSESLTLLAYVEKNYAFSSKINHIQITFVNRVYLVVIPGAILGVVVILWIPLTILLGIIIWKNTKRNRKEFLVIN